MSTGRILNLTQHAATDDQVAAGVAEPTNKKLVQTLLTFLAPPTPELIRERAIQLADVVVGSGMGLAMVGGASYLMPALEEELRRRGLQPMHSFSLRESKDTPQADGSVKKEFTFRHAAFVQSPLPQA